MNFYLPGLSNNIVNKLFNNEKIKYSGIQLQGCQFRRINLNNVNFSNSNLLGTEWGIGESQNESFWTSVNFSKCDFRYSNLDQIALKKCNFSSSNFAYARFVKLYIDGLTEFSSVNLIHSSLIFTHLTKQSQFLGSIIFRSDLLYWIYEFQDEFDYEIKTYTLEEVKYLGIVVLYEGEKQYKLCELNIQHKEIIILEHSPHYFLENISISYDDTIHANNDWKVEIEDLK